MLAARGGYLWLEQRRYVPLGSRASNGAGLAAAGLRPIWIRRWGELALRARQKRDRAVAARQVLSGGRSAELALLPRNIAGAAPARASDCGRRDGGPNGDRDPARAQRALRLDEALARLQQLAPQRNRDVRKSLIWRSATCARWWMTTCGRIGSATRPPVRCAGEGAGLKRAPRHDDIACACAPRCRILASEGRDAALQAQATILPNAALAEAQYGGRPMVETVCRRRAARRPRTVRVAWRRRSRRRPGGERRSYAALGSFGDPALARSAPALMLDPARTTIAKPRAGSHGRLSGTPQGARWCSPS
jgi:hypothetical protein